MGRLVGAEAGLGGGGQAQDADVQKPEGFGLHSEGEGPSLVRIVGRIVAKWPTGEGPGGGVMAVIQ